MIAALMTVAALQVGSAATVVVEARQRWNASGIPVRRGEVYALEVPPGQTWNDASHTVGPDGYELPKLDKFVRWRRRRDQKWFALIGAVGKDEKRSFPVLTGIAQWTAPADGELFFYANDVRIMYGNNSGSVSVTVRRARLAPPPSSPA